VALSLRSPLLGVTQRPALWSPDFPQAAKSCPRLPGLLTTNNITRPVEGVKASNTLDIRNTGYISLLLHGFLCQPSRPVVSFLGVLVNPGYPKAAAVSKKHRCVSRQC
jgi:hypothetical protein